MSALRAFNRNFTNGFAEMMATEMVDSLRDASPWNCFSADVTSKDDDAHTCVYKAMKNNFVLSDAKNGLPANIKAFGIDGTDVSSVFNDTIRYTLPNNTTVNMRFQTSASDKGKADCEAIKDEGGSMCDIAAQILIDVNGDKRPNMVGKDIYLFALAPDGKLYPAGGKDWALYSDGDDWKVNCAGKPLPTACAGNDSLPLTGRVVEEGYQITYY